MVIVQFPNLWTQSVLLILHTTFMYGLVAKILMIKVVMVVNYKQLIVNYPLATRCSFVPAWPSISSVMGTGFVKY